MRDPARHDALALETNAVFLGRIDAGLIADYQAWERLAADARDHQPVAAGPPVVGRDATARLERRLPLAELVRFPRQSPHAVSRAYWANAVAVRGALPLLYERAGDPAAFIETLQGVHRLATLGEDGRTYHGGASGIPTTPGAVRTENVRTFVNAVLLGTLRWWLIDLGDRNRLLPDGVRESVDGAPLLEIRAGGRRCVHVCGEGASSVTARLDPVRQDLLTAVEAVARSDRSSAIAACARFHQGMVTVHPFANVNNSIAMNVVNDLLVQGGAGAVPHLFLDYLAIRLEPAAYEDVFAVAVERYGVGGSCRADRGDDLLRRTMTEHMERRRHEHR